MEPDWEAEDDEGFDGPDAYLEDEDQHEQDYELDGQDAIEVADSDVGDDSEIMERREDARDILQGFFNLHALSTVYDAPPDAEDENRLSFRDQIMALLNTVTNGGTVIEDYQPEVPSDDEELRARYEALRNRRRRPPRTQGWHQPAKEPQPAGVKLLMSGDFGRIGHKVNAAAGRRCVVHTLRRRSLTTRCLNKEDVTAGLVPNSNGTVVARYSENVYSGQFSSDSTFYYTCGQDFKLRVYDMTAPPRSIPEGGVRALHYDDHDTTMTVLSTIQGSHGYWTITDSHLSPDNERIIYSSMTPTVYMSKTFDDQGTQVALRFADSTRHRTGYNYDLDRFPIYSCRFSADGKEVIAAGRRGIFVYDLDADKRTVKITAHDDDVNSCCWADTASGNVLISASDDSFLKIWDRRSLSASTKPSGVLIGHTEGITNVSAKGDGRYIISNGKDQALRLWDLRKMRSNLEYDECRRTSYGMRHFDYRHEFYEPPHRTHPKDCSVMTYRGHRVFKTLIRCHFSPAETTGGQYIYSGSADGRIHIWSLDGRLVQVLDRSQTLPISYDPSAPELPRLGGGRSSYPVCVRDVSWHSREPVVMSAGWNGGSGYSSVARHEWKSFMKMSLEDQVEIDKLENMVHPQRASRFMPGEFPDAEAEENDGGSD